MTAAIAQVFIIAQSLAMARWFGPEEYAVYVANFSLCALSIFLVNWGLDTWLLRISTDKESLRELTGTVILLKIVFGIFWGALLFIIAPTLKPTLYLPSVLLLAIIGTFSESITNTFYVVFFTTNRFKQSSLILIFARTLRLISTIVLILFSIRNLIDFVILRVAIDCLILIFTWFKIKPRIHVDGINNLLKVFTSAMPYSGSDLLALFYNQADINLVSMLSPKFDIISFYSLAINIVNVVFAIVQGLLNVIIPTLARVFVQNKENIKKYSITSLLGFGLIGLLSFIFIQFFGDGIIELALGLNFSSVITYLDWIAPIFLLRSLIFGITGILIAINQQKMRIIPQSVAVIFKVLASVIIYPVWNVMGLSRIYIVSEILLLIGYCWVLNRSFSLERKFETKVPNKEELS